MKIIDAEKILELIGNKTRRKIIELIGKEPCFVSQISQELNVGQKAIIEHLKVLEEAGIVESTFKRVQRGRPRKYYKIRDNIAIKVVISKEDFRVEVSSDTEDEEMMRLKYLEKKAKNGNIEAINEIKQLLERYETLRTEALRILNDIINRK